jgi:hypothetical protein
MTTDDESFELKPTGEASLMRHLMSKIDARQLPCTVINQTLSLMEQRTHVSANTPVACRYVLLPRKCRTAEAGRLMARHFVRLPTMVTFVTLPRASSSMAALIGALARADEFKGIMLRRWGWAMSA